MLDTVLASPAVQAVAVLALVSVEAVALYLGYGVVERRAAPALFERIEAEG